jgi:hypothetical protein
VVSSLVFSKSGRFLYCVSTSWPSSILQIDLWRQRISRTVYDPFNRDGQVTALSLTMYGKDVFVAGIDSSAVVLCRLPFREGAKLEKTTIAAGPNELSTRTHLDIIWPESVHDDVVVVARSKNLLKEAKGVARTAMWPIVMTFKERDIGQWTIMKERQDPRQSTAAEESALYDMENVKGEATSKLTSESSYSLSVPTA